MQRIHPVYSSFANFAYNRLIQLTEQSQRQVYCQIYLVKMKSLESYQMPEHFE